MASHVTDPCIEQSQIQDFPKGAAPFVSSAKSSTRFSGGGGVLAEFSRDLPESTRFRGGGGSSRNFPWSQNSRRDARDSVLSINPTRFISGGGGGSASNFPVMGPFTFFFFPKGEARGPLGPPP